MTKMLVIGLDGATWNLLMPWIKDGHLPTLSGLVKDGVHGLLESTIPFITIPAWKCYSTGKNPGKLGVFLFYRIDMKNKKLEIHSSKDFKAKEIWDYLGDYGFKSGVINMAGTYPPKSINGFMISDQPGASGDCVYPPSLKEKLETVGYVFEPGINFKTSPLDEIAMNKLKSLFKIQFKVAKELNEVDFLHLSLFYIDPAQHFYWNDLDKIRDLWSYIDNELGNFLQGIEKDTFLFIISDHGFCKLRNTFYINNWLINNGYLSLKKESKVLKTFFELQHILGDILSLSGRIGSKLGISSKEWRKRTELISKIDWSKTRAIGLGYGIGLIYLNHEGNGLDYKDLNRQIKRQLQEIKDPLTKEEAIEVFEKEEIYNGFYIDQAPDLIVVPKSGYQVVENTNNPENIWGTCPQNREAFHERCGIFLAYGPCIRKSVKIDPITIYDIAPTILHIFGVPMPSDIDGKVIKEIFEKDGELFKRPVAYQRVISQGKNKYLTEDVASSYNKEDEKKIKQRLKDLGYL